MVQTKCSPLLIVFLYSYLYKGFQFNKSQQSVHVGLNTNKNLLILVFYVFVVGLWENKAGYYDLNSQGRETCHMTTKETPLYYKVVIYSII